MSYTSKSPVAVAKQALRVAAEALPRYAHRFSPKKFTQPQLFACLVLKTFFKTDYRGIAIALEDLPDLRRVLALRVVPHWSPKRGRIHIVRSEKGKSEKGKSEKGTHLY